MMDKNTQQPVAWISERGLPESVASAPKLPTGTLLYTAPPVPRDVLMALAVEVRTAMVSSCEAWGGIVQATKRVNLAAIADRYVDQVPQIELDIALFAKTIGDFEACNETDTPHETLLQFARAGWLHCIEFEVIENDTLKCVRFQITKAGRAVLASAQDQKEGSA